MVRFSGGHDAGVSSACGIWSLELRFGDHGEAAETAAELEELGYSALWVPGGVGGDVTGDLDRLLNATDSLTVATGILNIWKHTPAEIATWWKALPGGKRARVLLGLGVSHAHVVGDDYRKPLLSHRSARYGQQVRAPGGSPAGGQR